MRLTVDHVTRYHYDRPVRSVVQSHRLTPSKYQGQKVIDWAVAVSGGTRGSEFRDGAGDLVQGWTVAGPVGEVTVRVTGTVETADLTGVLRGHKEIVAPDCYMRPTGPTRVDKALDALAQSVSAPDPLALAHALMGAVADAIAYKPGVTHAHTTAAEALALGEGVCQDHAHAMIAVARARGVPGRYVSGYLFADAAGDAHEAAHAWAEVYLTGLGWVGFDPANRCCATSGWALALTHRMRHRSGASRAAAGGKRWK
jgi:transglutaminase-like putative cysteine protease